MSLTIAQARDDLLSKLGIEDSSTATALMLQDVVIALNGAFQYLQTAGEDFFTRQALTLAIQAGTALYPLTQSVQQVIGPIRLNGSKPLRALESRGELDQYARIFGGSASYGSGVGEPSAYWIENIRVGTTGDITLSNLWLAPVPSAGGTVAMDVIYDAPVYTASDFTPGTLVLPVAQNYTESIFLPIARMLITRSSQFSRPDILDGLTEDFKTAIARLGMDGGFPDITPVGTKRETQA